MLFLFIFLFLYIDSTESKQLVLNASNYTQSVVNNAKLKPGDSIVFVGVIPYGIIFSVLKGNKTCPITITSDRTRPAIFDCTGVGGTSMLVDTCSYLTFVNITFRNCDYGFIVSDGIGITATNLTIYNMNHHGATLSGINILFQNNHLYNNCLSTISGLPTPSQWNQCVSSDTTILTTNKLSNNITIQDNLIHDCWGEGIDMIYTELSTVRRNIIYNTYSVLLYTDNSQNLWVEGNLMYTSDPKYYTLEYITQGCVFATEAWPDVPIPVVNITYVNNLVINAGMAVGNYRQTQYTTRIRIFHNAFVRIRGTGFYFEDQAEFNSIVSGNYLMNNFFSYTNTTDCAGIGSQALRNTWTIQGNIWQGCPVNTQNSNIMNAASSQILTLFPPNALNCDPFNPVTCHGLVKTGNFCNILGSLTLPNWAEGQDTSHWEENVNVSVVVIGIVVGVLVLVAVGTFVYVKVRKERSEAF